MFRRPSGIEHLEEAKAKRGHHRTIELVNASSRKLGRDVIRGAAPLDGAVGESLGECSLSAC